MLDFTHPARISQSLWGELFPVIDEANPRYL
jgi:hypothetical protein